MNWINPIALQIGPISIYWYGIMYALTFIAAYLILQYHPIAKKLPLTSAQKDNLLIILIAAIILGGRLGYILFYNSAYYFQNPAKILAIWEGGLSFHGGLIATIITIAIYAKLHHKKTVSHDPSSRPNLFLQIADLAVLIAPIGILLGRFGNFINAELYGRIASSNNPLAKLCLNFPTDPANCRYPSQLFEALGEGLLLGLFLHLLARNSKISNNPGRLSAIFLICYGLIRTLIEYTREPDVQLGFIFGGPGFLQGLSLGQILSLLTALAGLVVWLLVSRKKTA
ncbi:prolipoprotein diacylglyceryl transferase [Candidatus Peregrinibacteria bacterium]|nr:prolipoprotein diacylglyceryl transferase [Candidatus Peregrinibacteria bacterium]